MPPRPDLLEIVPETPYTENYSIVLTQDPGKG